MQGLDKWLDANLVELQRQLNTASRRMIGAVQSARRGVDWGDLTRLETALAQLESSIPTIQDLATSFRQSMQTYDVDGFVRGQLEVDLREACAAKNLRIEGTFPSYFVSPVRIRVDPRTGRVRLNKKVLNGLRATRIVEEIIAERERIVRRPFNSREFLRELGAAYDDLVSLESSRNGVKVQGIERELKQVYQRLTPRREWREQYPEAFFTYDLHRLLSAEELYLPDGRRYYLAPSRSARKNLTILDRGGREVQYGLISFR